MSSVIIAGDTSGTVTLQAPAVAGTTTLTLPATSGTIALSGGAITGTTGSFTGNLAFNSGYGSAATAYGCRAWVNFAGGASSATIRASANVSSVTRNGSGDYRINLTNAMPDTNYAVIVSCNEFQSYYNGGLRAGQGYTVSTSVAGACCSYVNGGSSDAGIFNVAIFR